MNERTAEPPDEELVRSVQTGDQEALSTLYRQSLTPVYRFVRRRVPTTEIAEDLTSEIFLAVVEQIGRFRFQASFRTWLFTIARRRIAEYWRRQYRLPETAIEPVLWLLATPGDRPDSVHDSQRAGPPDDAVVASLEQPDVRKLLAGLPERDRRVLECRFLDGKSVAETAAALGLREGNVKVIQHRAIQKLAQRAP